MCKRHAFYQNRDYRQTGKYRKYGEHPVQKFWKEKMRQRLSSPPVNILEMDDKYELYLFAPGLEKNDFSIAVADKILSISASEKQQEQDNWKRQEFQAGGFERQFELNSKIDDAVIEAKYENGVLIVSLPKLKGFETKRQDIEVE